MGWIGTDSELMSALSVIGADVDEEGKVLIGGPEGCVVSFLGIGDEFVVSDEAVYFSKGQPCSLVGLLNSTSYGLKVAVIA